MNGISVVIPSFNEASNLPPLIREVVAALSPWCPEFEVIAVCDGSTDGSAEAVSSLGLPNVRIESHQSRRGKTEAWATGIGAARFQIICTIDGDCQDDPADIQALYEEFEGGADLVTGRRMNRNFTAARNAASLFGNSLLRYLTGTALRDQGCGIKVFKREVFERAFLRHEMHRFFPLIVELTGFTVREHPVRNRPRANGESKYTWRRVPAFAKGIWNLRGYLAKSSSTAEFLRDRIYFLAIVACTAVATALRFSALSKEGLWYDESLSVHYASLPLAKIPDALGKWSVHPPLYFFVLHIWGNLFSFSELSIRALSAACGVATVPAIAALARTLFNRTAALGAALLLTLSSFHLFQCQNARPYTLMALLLTISFTAYLRLLEIDTRRATATYLVSTILLSYTHAYALCALPAQALHFLLAGRRTLSLRRFATLQLIIALSFMPWLASFLAQARRPHTWNWITPVGLDTFSELLTTFSGEGIWLELSILALTITAIVTAIRSANGVYRGAMGATLLWFAVPIICGVGISVLYAPTFSSRYMQQSFIMLLIMAGAGLHRGFRSIEGRLLACTVVTLSSIAPIDGYFRFPQRAEWREAVAFVESKARESDALFYEFPINPIGYYKRRNLRVLTELTKLKGCPPESPDPLCRPGSRVWIVHNPIADKMLPKILKRFSETGFKTASEWSEFHDLRILLLERNDSRPS